MKIIEGIRIIIDSMAVIIQVPYMIIAGAIMGESYIPFIGSNDVYVWYPTYDVIKVWMQPNGDITYDLVTYKELFR